MVTKRTGLGRNLSALLGTTSIISDSPTTNQLSLPITSLSPGSFQPRRTFDESLLNELADSIRKQGVLQPLIVRTKAQDSYEIIAGERRFRAAQIAGLTEVPVICHQVDDKQALAIALIENLQRDDLNVIEESKAFARLTDEFHLTHEQVGELVGKSRSAVSNALRLLQLNPEIHLMLEQGHLDMGHARCLLTLGKEKQLKVAEIIKSKQLSVREAEKLVARVNSDNSSNTKIYAYNPVNEKYEDDIFRLAAKLNTKVTLKPQKTGGGQVIIHYKDDKTLKDILQNIE